MGSKCTKPITVDVDINGTTVCMEIDTGAAVSLMAQPIQEKFFPEAILKQSPTHL